MGKVIANVDPTRKYNEDRHERIIEAIKAGNSRTTAFKLAGLNEQTPFDWMSQGERDPEKYPEYVKLKEDIIQAEAEFEASRVAIVKVAADTGTWQAAAWWLERRKPEDWGRNRDALPAGPSVVNNQLNQVVLIDSGAREASRELLRRVTAGGAGIPLGPGVGDAPPTDTTS